MDLITELMSEIKLNDFEVGSSTWVDVTYINNPHSFYVRPISYRNFISSIELNGQKLVQQDLKVNMKIVYYSEVLEQFCRGLIYNINTATENCMCEVFAIDYGCMEKTVSLKDMFYPLVEEEVAPLATHCQLAYCEPNKGSWKDEDIDAMKTYVGTESAKLIVTAKTNVKLIVELYNSSPDDISTMLALTGYCNMGYNENAISCIPEAFPEHKQEPCFTYTKLKPGKYYHVRTLTGRELNSFYVAKVKDYDNYINNISDLRDYSSHAKNLKPEEIKVDKPVIVLERRFQRYERGIVQKIISENKAAVWLVDRGTVAEVAMFHMKPMSLCYLRNPAIAIHCTIDKDQHYIHTKPVELLHPGFEFLIKIKEMGDEFEKPNIVTISPLNKK